MSATPSGALPARRRTGGLPLPLAASAGLVFLNAWAVYWGTATLLGVTGSHPYAYFPELAEAFLAGRLWIVPPPWTMDLTFHDGQWYLPFPPLPALLLLPWVAVAGRDGVNSVLFSTLLGAVAVALVFALLETCARRGWSKLDWTDNLLLTVVFGVGSVQWVIALSGAVWHLGQAAAVLFSVLAALLAASRAPAMLAGGALAVAMLARPNLALGLPLLLGFAAQQIVDDGGSLASREGRWSLLRWTALAAVPMVVVVGLLLAYNAARFGSIFDFGYTRQVLYDVHAEKLATYGWFNLRYIPENVQAMLLALPRWEGGRLFPDWTGLSLLITTPALVLLWRARRPSAVVIGAWLAVGLLLVPLLTYYNTGYKQFGYRFSLDFMAPLMVLLALALGRRAGWFAVLLMLAGVVVNAWGVWAVYG
ncbi:MAG: hypothetical protein U0556_18100 [Dehalococcoidia bacterium]